MLDYMTTAEVIASRNVGNRIARQITGKRPIRANAAIRHAMATMGPHGAATFASALLGISRDDGAVLVKRLQASRPDDIVSPHGQVSFPAR